MIVQTDDEEELEPQPQQVQSQALQFSAQQPRSNSQLKLFINNTSLTQNEKLVLPGRPTSSAKKFRLSEQGPDFNAKKQSNFKNKKEIAVTRIIKKQKRNWQEQRKKEERKHDDDAEMSQ